MNKIVVINGYAGVGKDTFINLCKRYVYCDNVSSIDQLNEFAYMIGWDGVKTNNYRVFMSRLKELCVEFNDSPFNYLKNSISQFYAYCSNGVLFLHIREPQEIAKVCVEFNVIKLHIKNNRVPVPPNVTSELNVANIDYDYVVNNDGSLADLNNEARKFVTWLGFTPKE